MIRLCIVLFISVLTGCKKNTTTGIDNSPAKDPLAKGINLSNWFNDYSDPGQYGNRFTLPALQLIKSSGFSYVRIPVGSTLLFNAANPGQLNSAALSYVDAAVTNCINAGLAVSLNLHPWQNDIDSLLSTDAGFVNKVAVY